MCTYMKNNDLLVQGNKSDLLNNNSNRNGKTYGLQSDELFDLMSSLLPCGFKMHIQTASSVSHSPVIILPFYPSQFASFPIPAKVWGLWI